MRSDFISHNIHTSVAGRITLTCCTLLIVILTTDGDVIAQDNVNKDTILERTLEQLDPDSEAQSALLLQRLTDLLEHPININRATTTKIARLPWINLVRARAITEYRKQHPPFEKVSQLAEVKGLGKTTVDRIAPFLTAGAVADIRRQQLSDPRFWLDDVYVENISRYRRMLQTREGFKTDSTGYLGRPGQWYQRIKLASRHLSINITLDQDAGEPFRGPTGFDYTSAHLAVRDVGKWRNIVVGDYSLSFGQGLLWSGGGMFGKGRTVIESTSPVGGGIDPYSSSQETNGQRGLALTYGDRLRITGFYSNRARSASPLGKDTYRFPTTSSYHRTDTEIARRHNIRQRLFGGMINWRKQNYQLGATAYRLTFDHFISHNDAVYNLHDFEGRMMSAASLFYAFQLSSISLFGELGLQLPNKSHALLAGMQFRPGESTSLAMAYRNYAPDFQAPFGRALAEQSGSPQNERGFYFAIRHELNDRWMLSGYLDVYSFPTPRYGMHRPSRGFDWLTQVETEFTDQWSAYLLVRGESEEAEQEGLDGSGRTTLHMAMDHRWSIRMQHSFDLDSGFRFRLRAEIKRSMPAGNDKQWGILFYPDLRWQPLPGLRLYLRYTMFKTEGYESRLYQFENDLLYVLSNTMLQDEGQRSYMMLSWSPLEWLDVQAKYGQTVYDNLHELGSGPSAIDGNIRSRAGFQLRMRW